MSEKQPRGIPRIPFPLTVPRQGIGDTVPTASSQFAGQVRTFIGVSGYVDGLYICDTNLAGTWGWWKIHGHGQPLGAQSFTGAVSVAGNLAVAGNISATGGGDLAVDDITADAIVASTINASSAALSTLSVVSPPWKTILKGSLSYNAPSIASGGQHSFTISVPGAASTDGVVVNGDGMSLGLIAYGLVSPVNTVTVTLCNFSAVSVDPALQTYYVYVIRW